METAEPHGRLPLPHDPAEDRSIDRVVTLANNPGPCTPNLRGITGTRNIDDHRSRCTTAAPVPTMTKISLGGLELRFILDKTTTGGRLDVFEMVVHRKAKMPVAHFHKTWDEMIYGLRGTTTWRIDGGDHLAGPGRSVFVPRGTIHGLRNDTDEVASCLCVLTPGVLGQDYFQEMAALVASGAPDPEAMKTLMLRYGLVPAPNG